MSCPFERLADVPEVWILIFTDFGERPWRAALVGGQLLFIFHASRQAEGKTKVSQASSDVFSVRRQEVSKAAHKS